MDEHSGDTLGSVVTALSSRYPGFTQLVDNLCNVLTSTTQSFIYLQDPVTPRLTTQVTRDALSALQGCQIEGSYSIKFAAVDATSCFHPKIIYDSLLNALTETTPQWETGCSIWPDSASCGSMFGQWNNSMDGFCAGLRSVWNRVTGGNDWSRHEAGSRIVLVFERAEKLKERPGNILSSFTNLQEVAGIPVTTIFISSLSWELFRPSLGSLANPLVIQVQTPNKKETASYLSSVFLNACSEATQTNNSSPHSPFRAHLEPLYSHFIDALIAVCFTFVNDRTELAYIAAANWTNFVLPVLENYEPQVGAKQRTLSEFEENEGLTTLATHQNTLADELRLKLISAFNIHFVSSLDSLQSRAITATVWQNILLQTHSNSGTFTRLSKHADLPALELSRMHKWLTLSSFFASYNPSRMDMKLFHRASDELRRVKKGGGTRKNAASTNRKTKIPSRILGPSHFSIDRLLAILGSMLAEHETYPLWSTTNSTFRCHPDIEMQRVSLLSGVTELLEMGLLECVSVTDKQVASVLRCNTSYEVILKIGKELFLDPTELLWDSRN